MAELGNTLMSQKPVVEKSGKFILRLVRGEKQAVQSLPSQTHLMDARD